MKRATCLLARAVFVDGRRHQRRKRARRDARMYAVRLTDKGAAALKAADPAARVTDERLLAALPAPQRDVFIDALKRVIDQLSVANIQARPSGR